MVQRFFRLERSRTTPGSGLGLSLVAAIARHHHAALLLQDNEPGLDAVLRFPVYPGYSAIGQDKVETSPVEKTIFLQPERPANG